MSKKSDPCRHRISTARSLARPAWSHADDIHIMHVINGRFTGRRNKGRKRLDHDRR